MFQSILYFFTSSIKRQLIVGIALVHAVMMSFFIFDLVERQRQFLYDQGEKRTIALTRMIASNSISWVLASDVIGLEELLNSIKNYPDLRYAMIVDPDGKILGHTESDKIGKYFKDSRSLSILTKEPKVSILYQDSQLIDVVAPILLNQHLVGWARIGLWQKKNNESLEKVGLEGLAYTLAAIIAGTIIAWFMGKGMTLDLHRILHVASLVRAGGNDVRSAVNRSDEIGQLSSEFNQMLDVLDSNERALIKARENLEKDIEARKTAEEEIRTLNAELESIVEIRTRDLSIANENLLQEKEKAVQANRAKSVFLASMSHELRTPMNAILGFTALIKNSHNLDQEQISHLDIISRSGSHLLSIINDVLDMSRIESGKMILEKDSIDLPRFIDDLSRMFRFRAEGKGLVFETDFDVGDCHYINSDSRKLRQILINLLGNAVKYTDQGFIRFSLRIRDRGHGNLDLIFHVEDSGRGIGAEDLEKIYEPFYQTENSRIMGEGTGLGLSITREFVNFLKGQIDIESLPGKGSRFTVILPVQKWEGELEWKGEIPPQDQEDSTPDSELPDRILFKSMIQGIPAQIRRELRRILIELDDEKAIELVNRLDDHGPGIVILKYIGEFRHGELIQLLEEEDDGPVQ